MDMQGHDMGDMNNDADAQDPPDIHGMAVIGQKSVFLSHLPMFGSPHDYQVSGGSWASASLFISPISWLCMSMCAP